MRRTLGICLAASLTIWLGGCSDDDSVCIDCKEEVDADTSDTSEDTSDDTTSTEPNTDAGTTSQTQGTSSNSNGTDASVPETDSGSTSETPTDGGSDNASESSEPRDAAVSGDDGGTTAADAGDAGLDDAATDAGDEPALPPCEQVCVTAAPLDCASCDFCTFLDINPECDVEANEYLQCVADSSIDDFVCSDDAVSYVSYGCQELSDTWAACAFAEE
jgi:hypothetical protein